MSAEQSTVTYREIPEFPGYRVGDDGSVWSRRRRWRGGTADRPLGAGGWRRLKPHKGRNGRIRVKLLRSDSRGWSTEYVHRLVLLAFIGPCPPGQEGCHFPDRDPANCNLSNLRWDTPEGNHADRLFHGTECRGEKHVFAKLKAGDVRFIRENVGKVSHREMARRFGVTHQLIADVVHRRSWGWLE